METPEIFLSHCWDDKLVAERIYNILTQVGIKVKMDNHSLRYKDNIMSFMESIRDCDFAILLISDKYLKSKNCLHEILNLLKEKTYIEKILPVILETANVYSTKDRLEYLQYWTNQQIELDNILKTVDPINALESYNDLKVIQSIVQTIDSFLKEISTILNVTFKELEKSGYREIIEKIGYQDISYLVELLHISTLEKTDDRHLELDKYLTNHQADTFYYAIKASTYLKDGKVKQAKFCYEESIKLDPLNTTSLNNLGNLCNTLTKEYDLAKVYFEKVIEIDPEHTIARLNLGVLLSHNFNDEEGAKLQYETILSYNEFEPKAYNNLANYYKKKGNEIDKVLSYLNKATEINPNYIEAYINLGNFFKVNGKLEEGNSYYRKALTMTDDENYIKFINILLASTKG